ncbi:MAG TPA: peptide-methionine (S)-S-oxide reductase MsrA [Nitrospiraceae bacterium]|nr:peptide-methionine (S)-S-oxide reductase MsrA [Nitrospiraceae bacterium]
MTTRCTTTLWLLAMLLAAGPQVYAEQPTATSGTAAKAYFAGGCFWCMEEAFEKLDGVLDVVSGYMGGSVKNPSYEQVSAGQTGHAESVEVRYDPAKVTYTQLLEAFWRNVDPITPNAQFCDHGNQYRAAIFYQGEDERRAAEDSKRAIEQSKRFSTPIVTQLTAASEFYPAEEYHQDFYKKNPIRYKYYKFTCGRTQRLESLWGS